MNHQLSVVIPSFTSNSSADSAKDDVFFEERGTLEEILLLGPKVPLASVLSKQNNATQKICLELVHLHATRDHIVLIDPRILNIKADEALALRESVQETIEHFLGNDGEFSDQRWIFPAGSFEDVLTHSPSQANGLNIDIWLPKDKNTPGIAKHWRKLQNEIQMVWHNHPVNEARLLRGELSINSVWLYGIGSREDVAQHPLLHSVDRIFSNHYLGSALDPRIQGLSKDSFAESSTRHDFIFAHDMSSSDWENYWHSLIEDLFKERIATIQLLQVFGQQIKEHVITSQTFKSNFLVKLFSRSKNQSKVPAWEDYSTKIHWTPL
jgi:hypothetical protein